MRRFACAALLCGTTTLASCVPAPPAPPAPAPDARIVALVAEVSESRLDALVTRLAGFGTRHTLSTTTSPTRGIGAAREWIAAELRAIPGLAVSVETFSLVRDGRITRDAELRNVLAILPGRSARRIYLSAHYDTVNVGGAGQIDNSTRAPGERAADPQLRAGQDYDVDAPGANDNGSGTALTMELARVLAGSGLAFDATIVFALWAGEEQGLVGSRAHLQHPAGEGADIHAVFNNDIVGSSRGGSGVVERDAVRVYSEGGEDSPSRALARHAARAAALYVPSHRVRLMARLDRFGRSSDHAAFNDRGFAALTFREANEDFSRQHGGGDTRDGVDVAYLAQNARINLASVASLALAPPPPAVADDSGRPMIGRQPSGYDATLRWRPVPGAASYTVYWRPTWSNDWERSAHAGDTTEFTLPGISIDDYVFGVAAASAGGHESVVTSYVAARAPLPPVRLAP